MSSPPGVPAPRRRLFWTAVVLAALVVVAGVVVSVRGWLATDGPDGAVRGYFAALADGDAATALGYGTIPAGSRALLTDTVLREQQRIAAIEDVRIDRVQTDGDRARVSVRYALDFAGGARDVTAVVGVKRVDGDWRLDRAAVPTQLLIRQAVDRVSLLGAAVPDGSTLLFPGAVPVTFDTPYLQVDPSRGSVAPDAGTSTEVTVGVTAAGTAAARAAVRRALLGCLSAGADLRCPMPTERYVPGSIRGVLDDDLTDLKVQVTSSEVGELEITGDVEVRGRFRRLEFDNRVTTKTGTTFRLPVAAHTYAIAPVTLSWDRPT